MHARAEEIAANDALVAAGRGLDRVDLVDG
jgi:hypothetical protein